jgi:type II secretion system protein I
MSALRRRKRGKKGFTLIEVVAAITIMAVGITAILSAFNGMHRTHQLMKRRSEARLLANQIIAAVRLQSLTPDSEETEGTFGETDYQYSVTFNPTDETRWPNLYSVAIKISWGDEESGGDIFLYTLQNYG